MKIRARVEAFLSAFFELDHYADYIMLDEAAYLRASTDSEDLLKDIKELKEKLTFIEDIL